MNVAQFVAHLQEEDIPVNDRQLEQFAVYNRLLAEWNQKMNLTAITEPEEVYLKHFYDSLTAALQHPFQTRQTVIDVGAGAGFPSLPLKICYPHLRLTLVDSLRKRTTFLEHIVAQLELTDVHVFHDRAESFARNKEHREHYDVVLARAVARLNVLSELCLPLVKVGGTFLAMKGAQGRAELAEGHPAIQKLGGEVETVTSFNLPEGGGERQLILIRKNKSSPPKYPRKPGLPNKKPLA